MENSGSSLMSGNSSSSSSSNSPNVLSDSDINKLKEEYKNAQKEVQGKRDKIAKLEEQKKQLSNDQSNLNQLSAIDQQVKVLQSEVKSIEDQEKHIKSVYRSKGIELEKLIAQQNLLTSQIENANAEKAFFDQEFKDIDLELNNYDDCLNGLSSNGGQRLDPIKMVIDKIPEKMDPQNSKALLATCEKKSEGALDSLIAKMKDINAVDSNGMSLLLYSLKHAFVYGVHKLLEKGVDVNVSDNNGHTALMYACALPHMEYTNKIIDMVSVSEINKKSLKEGDTAMHMLCKNTGAGEMFISELELIKQLSGDASNNLYFTGTLVIDEDVTIGNEIVVGERQDDGYTLNQYKSLLICRKLKEKSADFNVLNDNGFSPYFYLCRSQQKYLANILKNEKIIDLDTIDSSGFQKAMGYLLLRDHEKLKDLISKHPECLHESTKKGGETLLHLATQMKDLELVKLLIDLGANQDIKSINAGGLTPLFYACATKQPDIAKYLISKSPDISIISDNGNDILSWVAELHDINLLQKMLDRGANINHRGQDGKTLLFWMVQYGWEDMVEFLMSKGADPNLATDMGEYPLILCVAKDNLNMLNTLLSYNITDVNKRTVDNNKITTLWMAAQDGKEKFIDALLSKGADVNISRESNLEAPIHISLKNGHSDVFNKLMNRTDIDAGAVDSNGQSILHYGVHLGRQDLIQLAIDRNIDINSQDNIGRTPLHLSCMYENTQILEFLHSKGGSIDVLSQGFHPMHGAVYNGHKDIIRKLLGFGVDINITSSDGITILHYAIMIAPKISLDVIKILLDHGANYHSVDNNGYTPLHNAIHNNRLDLVKELIERGADVNYCDHAKKVVTPLYFSMGYGGQQINIEIFDYLLSHGADPNIAMFNGDTAMHMAGYRGRYDLAKKLMANGADINAVNHEKQTPLYVCIKQEGFATNEEKIKTVKYFLAKGAKTETETEVSVLDLANQHLAESSGFFQSPETIPDLQSLEVELFGADNLA